MFGKVYFGEIDCWEVSLWLKYFFGDNETLGDRDGGLGFLLDNNLLLSGWKPPGDESGSASLYFMVSLVKSVSDTVVATTAA